MAVSASFKQPCPSCEALVPIKDIGMVGKKVDCPKCKYRFVVDFPGEAVDPDAETAPATSGKKEIAVKAGKPKAAKGSEAITANGKGAETKKQGAVAVADKEGAPETEEAPKKKKLDSAKKMKLGLALAAVGVVVLGVAAFLILGKGSPDKKKPVVQGRV